MDRFTHVVLRHRRWVYAFWSVMLVAGVVAAGQLTDRWSYDFSLPGQAGYETEIKLIEAYGTTSDALYIPVVTVPEGTTVEESADEVASVFDAVREIPGLRVVDHAATGDPAFITDDGRTTFGIVYAPPPTGFVDPNAEAVEQAVQSAATAAGLDATITGYAQLSEGGGGGDEGPSALTETLIGALGALAVLLFVFASFLALVPLVIAAVAILSTFLVILGMTTFTDVSFVVQFLVSLVGLGVAVDYSLLVVTRWREERALGATNEEAVVTAVRTAGHAVLASGVTVAISLLALIVIPVPLLRSMGFGGMLIPLASVSVVLTLLPAMLGGIGPRVDWPRIRHEDHASRGWTAWARAIVRFRWIAAGSALLVLGLMLVPLSKIQFGVASTESLASAGPAVDALATLENGGVGNGVVTPITVLVEGGEENADAIAEAAAGVDGVLTADAYPASPSGAIVVDVYPTEETVDSRTVAVVDDVKAAAEDLPGYVGVSGTGATIVDYRHAVYDLFPYVIAIIALITYVLLVRTFRSLLLPAKAVLLNLISMGAVFGLATWFWQEGHGSEAIFGIDATGAMTFWIPPVIFAFLFGLSMDYEVFILARMREEYDETGSTGEAVVRGLGRTGRLVTCAALILFWAFSALAASPGTDIKVIATALGVGILLDATLVRALLVPALVSLFGPYNWYLPGWAARLLRVEPSPLRPEPVALMGPSGRGGGSGTGPELVETGERG